MKVQRVERDGSRLWYLGTRGDGHRLVVLGVHDTAWFRWRTRMLEFTYYPRRSVWGRGLAMSVPKSTRRRGPFVRVMWRWRFATEILIGWRSKERMH